MAEDAKPLTGPDLEQGVEWRDLPRGDPLVGHAGGEAVVLVRRGEEAFAIGATCTHYSGPLGEGLVVGETVRCPWHHARFSLRTGEAVGAPALNPMRCWEVERDGRPGARLAQAAKSRHPRRAAGARAELGRDRGRRRRREPRAPKLSGAKATRARDAGRARAAGPSIAPTSRRTTSPAPRPRSGSRCATPDFYAAIGSTLVTGDPVADDRPRGAHGDAPERARRCPTARWSWPPAPSPDGCRSRARTGRTCTCSARSRTAARSSRARRAGRRAPWSSAPASSASRPRPRCAHRGLEVDVVAPEPVPLARVLGDEIGRVVRGASTRARRALPSRAKLRARSHAGEVELADGTRAAAPTVVAGRRRRAAHGAGGGGGARRGQRHRRGRAPARRARPTSTRPATWRAARPAHRAAVRIEHFVVAERQGQAAARSLLGTRRALPRRALLLEPALRRDALLRRARRELGPHRGARRLDRRSRLRGLLPAGRAGCWRSSPSAATRSACEAEAAMEKGDEARSSC